MRDDRDRRKLGYETGRARKSERRERKSETEGEEEGREMVLRGRPLGSKNKRKENTIDEMLERKDEGSLQEAMRGWKDE